MVEDLGHRGDQQEALLDVCLGHRLDGLARGQLQGVRVLASQIPEH